MKSVPTPGSQLTVTINSMDDEGRGRGIVTYADLKFNVAVRGAFTGDVVRVLIERAFPKHQLLVCRALEHTTQGPHHVERTCPHTGPCPACPLHGADISLSLKLKRERITEALKKAELEFAVDDVLNHPKEFGYRQKVKLMVGYDEKGKDTVVGTYIPYSHRLRPAYACPYVGSPLNDALSHIVPLVDAAYVKAIIARDTSNGIAVILVCHSPIPESQFDLFKALVDNKILISIAERIGEKNSNSILGGVAGQQYGHSDVDPDGFCQPDPTQAQIMYDIVAKYLTQENTDEYIIDAYAGVGGFSQSLLKHGAKHVIAIEQSPSSQAELKQLNIDVHTCAMCGAIPALSKLKINGLVVDPPKKGLMNDAEPIAKLGAKRVVLVSCDPNAMVKDLSIFLANKYKVERILPIDLFGGTPAVETLVFLTL